MTYIPSPTRYDTMAYRRCGKSGLLLPALSLGLWHNFGSITPFETQQSILRTAKNRPDLLKKADLTNKEWNQVRQWRKQWKEEKEQNDKE